MKLVLELPDIPFRVAKTPEDILREARQALVMFWLARGEIAPDRAAEMSEPAASPRDFKAVLASMPDVGDDADFQRERDLPRLETEWVT